MSDKLGKLLALKENDKLAIFEEMASLNENLGKVGKIFENFDPTALTHLNGPQGEPGQTHVRGVDYFTDDEVQDFLQKSTPDDQRLSDLMKPHIPQKGINYNDGINGKDARVFINEAPSEPEKGDIWIQV